MSKVLRILEGNFLVEIANHRQEQSTSIFLKPSLESYNSSKDTLSNNQENSRHQKTPIRTITKLSSIALKLENHQDTNFKPRTPPRKQIISNEYQEYLQGSLHKHIQSIKK